MKPSINAEDLPADVRRNLGIATPRQSQFSKDDCRGWALKLLAVVSSLSRAERQRVLTHALKVNRV